MTQAMEQGWGDRIYTQLFPLMILLCAATGVAAFAVEQTSASLNCFIAIFFGIRLDNHVELRRQAALEAAAEASWARLRGPVAA